MRRFLSFTTWRNGTKPRSFWYVTHVRWALKTRWTHCGRTPGITAACDAVWTLQKRLDGECVLDITGREMEEQTLGVRLLTGENFGSHRRRR